MKRILTITAVFLIIVFSIIMISPAATQNEVKKVMLTQTIYSEISNHITVNERELLARLVYLEARGESYLGQKAVVEVILNRVLSNEFPNTIDGVIYQKNQFSPAEYISTTTPSQVQYDIVNEVLSEIYPVLNINVLFFSTKQYNDLLYEQIGNHYFCYSTKSYQIQKGN